MIQKTGTLGNAGGPLLLERILTDSLVVAVGDSVQTTAGFLALGTAGSAVLGHIESLIGKDGLTPVKDGSYLGNIGEAYTAAATNETVAKISARVDIDPRSLYSAELDANIGTTAASALTGSHFDLLDKDTLDESTASATTGQYYSHGVDRAKTANVIVNIIESEVFGA